MGQGDFSLLLVKRFGQVKTARVLHFGSWRAPGQDGPMLMEKVKKIFSKVGLCLGQDGGLQLLLGKGWSSGWLDY